MVASLAESRMPANHDEAATVFLDQPSHVLQLLSGKRLLPDVAVNDDVVSQ